MAGAKIQASITAKDSASSVLRDFGGTIVAMNQGIELMGRALNAVKAPFEAVIKEGSEFKAQMSAVKAIAKLAAADFKQLSDEAKRIGDTTAFTSVQAGEAMEELRRAGQDVTKVLTTTNEAMDLAAATGAELATSARVTAVQMNIFKNSNLEAKKAVDLMVQTVGASPQSFEDLTFALDFSAGTASAMGIDFQGLTEILGAMAEAGVRGSKAGTALNTAMARLSKPSKEANEALKSYGISLDQVNPATNKFADIIDILNEKQVSQKDLFTLLGTETAPRFFKVIEAGGDVIRGFAEKQKQANTASEAASIRLDNLKGDVTIFGSAMSGLKISIFETLDGFLRKVVKSATGMATAFNNFVKMNQGPVTDFFKNMGEAIDVVDNAIAPLIRGLGSLLVALGTVIRSSVLIDLFDTIKASMLNVWNEGIKPLVAGLVSLGKEIFESITTNKSFATAVTKTAEVVKTLIEAITPVVTWVLKLGTSILKLISENFDPLLTIVSKIATIFLNFSNKIIKGLVASVNETIDGIKSLIPEISDLKKEMKETEESALDPFFEQLEKVADWLAADLTLAMDNIADLFIFLGKEAIAPVIKILVKINKWFLKLEKTISDFNDRATIAIKEFAAAMDQHLIKALKSVIGFFSSFGSSADEVTKSTEKLDRSVSNNLSKAFKTGEKAVQGFSKSIVDADEKSQDLEMTLTGNTLSKSAKKVGEEFVKTGKSLQQYGLDSKKADEESKKLDATLESIAENGEKVTDTLANVKAQQATVSELKQGAPVNESKGLGAGEAALGVGRTLASRVTGVGGAISGFQSGGVWGAVAGGITELLLSNEKFMAAFEELSTVIKEVVAPIIEPLVPAIQAVGKVLRRVAPIIERFVPLLNSLVFLTEKLIVTLEPLIIAIDNMLIGIENLTKVNESIKDFFVALTDSVKSLVDPIMTLTQPVKDLADPLKKLAEVIQNFNPLGGSGGGGAGGLFNKAKSAFGFQGGTDTLTRDQLLRLPGMEVGSGLVKAHAGEKIVPAGRSSSPVNMTFNIKALNPKEQTEELRQLMESLFLTGRLRVS